MKHTSIKQFVFVPSLAGSQSSTMADATPLTQYYAIGEFGKIESKQYAGRHYTTIFGDSFR